MLSGKVALVTGGAQGMGAHDAEALLKAGAKVAITDINAEAGRATATRLGAFGACTFLEHNVADEASWQRVVGDTLAAHGRIDVLVNNAGINKRDSVATTSLETWRRT
ncbi:MAG: SDR family NAD(P)-dependent oxidoreductase, partial [Alphaproteobacteria bacterium]|nr:SDR family NAD(P)-dependent oxidoreductase [Alphaproteobacteria bacterium]